MLVHFSMELLPRADALPARDPRPRCGSTVQGRASIKDGIKVSLAWKRDQLAGRRPPATKGAQMPSKRSVCHHPRGRLLPQFVTCRPHSHNLQPIGHNVNGYNLAAGQHFTSPCSDIK